MHGAVHANSPRYLVERVTAYVPHSSLRAADQPLVGVPMINLEHFGQQSYSCAGPAHWNSLPLRHRTL